MPKGKLLQITGRKTNARHDTGAGKRSRRRDESPEDRAPAIHGTQSDFQHTVAYAQSVARAGASTDPNRVRSRETTPSGGPISTDSYLECYYDPRDTAGFDSDASFKNPNFHRDPRDPAGKQPQEAVLQGPWDTYSAISTVEDHAYDPQGPVQERARSERSQVYTGVPASVYSSDTGEGYLASHAPAYLDWPEPLPYDVQPEGSTTDRSDLSEDGVREYWEQWLAHEPQATAPVTGTQECPQAIATTDSSLLRASLDYL